MKPRTAPQLYVGPLVREEIGNGADRYRSRRTQTVCHIQEKVITMLNETREGERRETIDELSDLLLVVQEMGRRLADETHGDSYSKVRELNELLHQTRVQLTKIKDGTVEGG